MQLFLNLFPFRIFLFFVWLDFKLLAASQTTLHDDQEEDYEQKNHDLIAF